jgi:hypothetical protein
MDKPQAEHKPRKSLVRRRDFARGGQKDPGGWLSRCIIGSMRTRPASCCFNFEASATLMYQTVWTAAPGKVLKMCKDMQSKSPFTAELLPENISISIGGSMPPNPSHVMESYSEYTALPRPRNEKSKVPDKKPEVPEKIPLSSARATRNPDNDRQVSHELSQDSGEDSGNNESGVEDQSNAAMEEKTDAKDVDLSPSPTKRSAQQGNEERPALPPRPTSAMSYERDPSALEQQPSASADYSTHQTQQLGPRSYDEATQSSDQQRVNDPNNTSQNAQGK